VHCKVVVDAAGFVCVPEMSCEHVPESLQAGPNIHSPRSVQSWFKGSKHAAEDTSRDAVHATKVRRHGHTHELACAAMHVTCVALHDSATISALWLTYARLNLNPNRPPARRRSTLLMTRHMASRCVCECVRARVCVCRYAVQMCITLAQVALPGWAWAPAVAVVLMLVVHSLNCPASSIKSASCTCVCQLPMECSQRPAFCACTHGNRRYGCAAVLLSISRWDGQPNLQGWIKDTKHAAEDVAKDAGHTAKVSASAFQLFKVA
jgi:hypothetical protein